MKLPAGGRLDMSDMSMFGPRSSSLASGSTTLIKNAALAKAGVESRLGVVDSKGGMEERRGMVVRRSGAACVVVLSEGAKMTGSKVEGSRG